MITNKIIYTAIISIISFSSLAQNSQLEKADEYYNDMSYVDAVNKYNKVVKTDSSSQVCGKLADSYLALGNTTEAEKWYKKAVAESPENAEYVLKYANTLRQNKKYDESMKWMERYQKLSPNDTRGVMYVNKEIISPKTYENQFSITEEEWLNSSDRDFGLVIWKDKLIFSSSRKNPGLINRKDNRDNNSFLSSYITNVSVEEGEKTNIQQFLKKAPLNYHQGPMAITPEGICYITVSRANKSKLQRDTSGIAQLEIIRTKLDANGDFEEFETLSINRNGYSVGHPAVSNDGKSLYFTSNFPGGYGGTDLYVVSIEKDGTLGSPKNLGETINTEGNEMFPYISPKGDLFFSSEGLVGYGGLDLFRSTKQGKTFTKPENLGASINSSKDDFGMVFKDEKTGYFSSSRDGGKGLDDIYVFTMNKPFSYGPNLIGTLKNSNGEILGNSVIKVYQNGILVKEVVADKNGAYNFNLAPGTYELKALQDGKLVGKVDELVIKSGDKEINLDNEFVMTNNVYASVLPNEKGFLVTILGSNGSNQQMRTGDRGEFTFRLLNGLDYTIKLEKEEYLGISLKFDTKGINPGDELDLNKILDLSMTKIETGNHPTVAINFKPIYFDFGKYTIRKDAILELDKIVKLLNDNPKMEIELRSYTDSRGDKLFNKNLSDKRAIYSAEYIKKRITNPDRIKIIGYGETNLINQCSDNVECSEAEHQQNRRTEFRIISM